MRPRFLFLCAACAALLLPARCPGAERRLLRDYNQGKFDVAVQGYRAAAEKGGLAQVLDLAAVLKDLGDYDEASFVLSRARQRFGGDPQLLALLARLYYLNGHPGQALTVIAELIKLSPDDVETNILAGLCYEGLGKEEQARLSYEKVISLDKNNIIARLSLAQLYYRQNRLNESAENFRKVSVLDSSIGKVYGCWADVMYRLGNYREAFRLYEKTSFIDPGNTAVKEKVALAREKLGEDFFRDQHEKVVESRKGKTVVVRSAPRIEGVARVSVGLMTGFNGKIKFKCPVDFSIRDAGGDAVPCDANGLYEIESGEGKVVIRDEGGEQVACSRVLRIVPSSSGGCVMFFSIKTGGGTFWANMQDRSFRGTIELRARSEGRRGLDVINHVTLEEYLYSVVPSEMPSSWPLEALKAQAVAARSEAMRKCGRHKADGFDFCAEVHCQAYFGIEKETEASRQAVDQTSGVVMTANGRVVDGIYSSTCGGHTQDNIFADGTPISYLKGRPDMETATGPFPLSPYALEQWLRNPPPGILCDIPEYLSPSSFRWVRIYSRDEFARLMQKNGMTGDVRRILITRRNPSGHVEALKIKGSEGTIELEKELVIRKALGDLRSGLFKVEIKYGPDRLPEQVIFYGGGWGHGVGLCQAGACGLAVRGRDYREILRHYFNGVDFEKKY